MVAKEEHQLSQKETEKDVSMGVLLDLWRSRLSSKSLFWGVIINALAGKLISFRYVYCRDYSLVHYP